MPSPPADVLRVEGLRVRYGSIQAVDALSLRAGKGTVLTVLGPNGAGKTTTLEVCEGLRRPDAGLVRVLGRAPWRAPAAHRARVGVMLQKAGMPSGIRAVEAVRSAAALYADPYPVQDLVERFRLGPLSGRPFRRLSGGEQQRVGLAVALIGRPDLLLLDEPTSGMDPVMRRDTWEVLRECADQGATVVVTTHQIDEAEAVADSVALIAHGRTVVQDSPANLTRGTALLEFSAAPGHDTLALASKSRTVVETTRGRYRVEAPDDAGLLEAVVQWCAARGTAPTDVVLRRRSLEDVVLDLIEWNGSDEH